MRQIIGGLAYDTEKADKVAEFGVGDLGPPWDPPKPRLSAARALAASIDPVTGRRSPGAAFVERLYRTKSGKYFVHGAGNERSRWGRHTSMRRVGGVLFNGSVAGEGIEALSAAQARAWVEKNAQGQYETIFGAAEDA